MRLGELEAVVEQHGHAVAGAHAARGERARDPCRAVVQLGVRALDAVEDERRPIGVRRALRGASSALRCSAPCTRSPRALRRPG